jgi:hypothetical protein
MPTAAFAAPLPVLKPAVVMQPAPPPPVTPMQTQEGRCPICDRKVVGIPGQRRCKKCFSTF